MSRNKISLTVGIIGFFILTSGGLAYANRIFPAKWCGVAIIMGSILMFIKVMNYKSIKRQS